MNNVLLERVVRESYDESGASATLKLLIDYYMDSTITYEEYTYSVAFLNKLYTVKSVMINDEEIPLLLSALSLGEYRYRYSNAKLSRKYTALREKIESITGSRLKTLREL